MYGDLENAFRRIRNHLEIVKRQSVIIRYRKEKLWLGTVN
jgi:hypothetical protein